MGCTEPAHGSASVSCILHATGNDAITNERHDVVPRLVSMSYLFLQVPSQDALFEIYGIRHVAYQWFSELVAYAIFIGKVGTYITSGNGIAPGPLSNPCPTPFLGNLPYGVGFRNEHCHFGLSHDEETPPPVLFRVFFRGVVVEATGHYIRFVYKHAKRLE